MFHDDRPREGLRREGLRREGLRRDGLRRNGRRAIGGRAATGAGVRKRVVRGAVLAVAACLGLGLLLPAGVLHAQNGTPSGARAAVKTGLRVLLEQGGVPLAGRRVGLITNATGIDHDGRRNVDLLSRHAQINLVALYSPEHGLAGTARAGEAVASGHDAATGLPIYSLYGATTRPTGDMLEGIDVLVFDIQEIGTRFYTYIWTMAQAMEAAARHGKGFMVLDRPNPIRGVRVDGPVLDVLFRSFVGLYPIPVLHGMTVGELALLLHGEFGVGPQPEVVKMVGWRRDMWFEETGLPWVPTSPNIPTTRAALGFAATGVLGGTNVGNGTGTPYPFELVGAPWIRGNRLAAALNLYGLPGVIFVAAPAVPFTGSLDGEPRNGVYLLADDRNAFDPVLTGLALLSELRRRYPREFRWRQINGGGYWIDRLWGTDTVRRALERGVSARRVARAWEPEMTRFRAVRQRYLLYP